MDGQCFSSKRNVELWNGYSDRHRTNNPVEGWNSKLNKFVGDPHPNLYHIINKLKQDSAEVRGELTRMELCMPDAKRKKKYIALDGRIKRAIETHADNDLLKCLRALAYITKLE